MEVPGPLVRGLFLFGPTPQRVPLTFHIYKPAARLGEPHHLYPDYHHQTAHVAKSGNELLSMEAVSKNGIFKEKLALANLAKGVYLLEVTDGQLRILRCILKQ